MPYAFAKQGPGDETVDIGCLRHSADRRASSNLARGTKQKDSYVKGFESFSVWDVLDNANG